MKNIPNLLKAAIIVPLLLVATSCKKDFLESAPYALEDAKNFYKTTEQCKGAVMQAYNRTVHLGPIYLFIRHGLNEYAGDDLLRTQRDDFTVWHNFSADNVQFLWGWKYCFQGIYLCNYTLEKLKDAPIPQTDKDVLTAECKSIRAFMYYNVATRWGSTPIITSVLSADDYYKVPFSSATEVYAQVIKDFQEAIPALPKSWDNENKGRFSQAAAKHMLAKTYMQLAGYPINKPENWQKAVDILAEFVPNDKRGDYNLDLLPNYGHVYEKNHEQSVESVFEVNEMYLPEGAGISLEVGAPGNFLQAFSHPDEYEGFGGRDCLTADFLDEFEKDGEGKVIDKRYTYSVLEPGDVFYVTMAGDTCLHNSIGRLTIKNVKVNQATNALSYQIKDDSNKPYAGWSWVGKNNESYQNYKYLRNAKERTGLLNNAGLFGEDLNIKYLRFGDAILCYAEALNEVGRSAEATAYVNELRRRANNSVSIDPRRIYQKTIVTGNVPMVDAGLGKDALRDAIRHEWRVELGGEDWRYENIRRWGIAEARLHAMAAKSPKKGPSDNDASKYQKGSWDYFPIPSSEFRAK
jgi:hypothetical protein